MDVYAEYVDSTDSDVLKYNTYVKKKTNEATVIPVTVGFVGSDGDFAVEISFEYLPNRVRLSDMPNLAVDMARDDPIMYGIRDIIEYNALRGTSFVDNVNGRLGTSFSQSIMYPSNWNQEDIDDRDVFVRTWVEVYNLTLSCAYIDPTFLGLEL